MHWLQIYKLSHSIIIYWYFLNISTQEKLYCLQLLKHFFSSRKVTKNCGGFPPQCMRRRKCIFDNYIRLSKENFI